MRVLHLFGDWKWTGPSEPTLDLCLELRALGVKADLACLAPPPEASGSLLARARERGLEPRLDFRLERSISIVKNLDDVKKIADACADYDLLHVHFSHDHVVGGLGARRAGRVKIVRTNHKAIPTPRNIATRYLYRKLTDGYLTSSRAALEADVSRFGLRGWHVDPAMRLDRFTPREAPHEGFHLGVVARMQRHRRFDILLEGVKRAQVPDLKVLIVGRGTHMNEVAVEPAKRLGLSNVVFTGYLGPQYLDTLASFDALLFLVPGSDGTCRAVREAMAMGRAVIGARRGMIPELVDDGKTGLVIDDTPENIAGAIERLAADRAACRAMGAAGREKALRLYDGRHQAAAIRDIYQRILG
ncbi:MAG: glycosyltransferase family 4 protein [Planctomycetaceae bacterium]|nr:glycosyltransferase family 4 protein [Planctomycetaceae bacterium]